MKRVPCTSVQCPRPTPFLNPAPIFFYTASAKVPLTPAEVAKHNMAEDCWCIIHGGVYNLTSFLADHPAGPKIILKYAGKDATKAFDDSGHPKNIVSQLGLDHLYLGPVEG